MLNMKNSNTTLVKVKFPICVPATKVISIQIQLLLKLNVVMKQIVQQSINSNTTLVKVKLKI